MKNDEQHKLEELYSNLFLSETKDEFESALLKIIKLIPNDKELGEILRSIYNKENSLVE